jgi:hypothetical protein
MGVKIGLSRWEEYWLTLAKKKVLMIFFSYRERGNTRLEKIT